MIRLNIIIILGFILFGLSAYHATGDGGKSLPSNHPSLYSKDLTSFGQRIRNEVKKYLGVPYRNGGSTGKGVDCSGFIRLIYRNVLGVNLPYKVSSQFSLSSLRKVSEENLTTVDLLFFSQTGKREKISHVGIHLAGDQFAHATRKKGVNISRLANPHWKSRFVSAKRLTILEAPHI